MIERVAIYCRQSESSGAGERSLSLESQEAELRARCDREGWSVITAVREADLRGGQDETQRPNLARVLNMAAAGDITLVLVWDMSRLARDLEYQERWIRMFAASGVEVESHTEPEVRRNTLIRQIKGAINQDRTREISAHVRRAKRERASRGHHNGPVPYGYTRTPDGPFALGDPQAVAAVQLIFQMSAARASLVEMADALEAAGYPSPRARGSRWSFRTIRFVAANPAYRGVLVWGSVRVERAHPAIVDDDLWDAAQRAGRGPKAKTASSWLEGSIRHACGNAMYLVPAGNRRPMSTIRCRSTWPSYASLHGGRCPITPREGHTGRLEELAWRALSHGIANLPTAAAVAAAARDRWRSRSPEDRRARQQAEHRLAAAVSRLKRAEDLYLTGARDRAWLDIEEARAATETAEAEAALAALPAPPDPAAIEAALAPLRSLAAALTSPGMASPQARARLLRAVGTIVVHPTTTRCGRGVCPCVELVPHPHLAAIWPPQRTFEN